MIIAIPYTPPIRASRESWIFRANERLEKILLILYLRTYILTYPRTHVPTRSSENNSPPWPTFSVLEAPFQDPVRRRKSSVHAQTRRVPVLVLAGARAEVPLAEFFFRLLASLFSPHNSRNPTTRAGHRTVGVVTPRPSCRSHVRSVEVYVPSYPFLPHSSRAPAIAAQLPHTPN